MPYRFVSPPGWPPAPPTWRPGPGWIPDPAWPPAPDGWEFWVEEEPPAPLRPGLPTPAVQVFPPDGEPGPLVPAGWPRAGRPDATLPVPAELRDRFDPILPPRVIRSVADLDGDVLLPPLSDAAPPAPDGPASASGPGLASGPIPVAGGPPVEGPEATTVIDPARSDRSDRPDRPADPPVTGPLPAPAPGPPTGRAAGDERRPGAVPADRDRRLPIAPGASLSSFDVLDRSPAPPRDGTAPAPAGLAPAGLGPRSAAADSTTDPAVAAADRSADPDAEPAWAAGGDVGPAGALGPAFPVPEGAYPVARPGMTVRTPRPTPAPSRMRLLGWSALGLVLLALLSVAAGALVAPSLVAPDAETGTAAGTAAGAGAGAGAGAQAGTGSTGSGAGGAGAAAASVGGATTAASTGEPSGSPTAGGGSGATPTTPAPARVTSIVDPVDVAVAGARLGTALAALGDLTVAGVDDTPFRAARFGPGADDAGDTDANGCDQRDDALRRDLDRTTIEPGTRGCRVAAGVLDDPWSGRTVRYAPGGDDVRVEPVVPLADAWAKGARDWPAAQRRRFATDLLNLQTVAAGAEPRGDATGWLPPAPERCAYVARQVAVKLRYGLSVTPDERVVLGTVLSGCPARRLPEAEVVPRGR